MEIRVPFHHVVVYQSTQRKMSSAPWCSWSATAADDSAGIFKTGVEGFAHLLVATGKATPFEGFTYEVGAKNLSIR